MNRKPLSRVPGITWSVLALLAFPATGQGQYQKPPAPAAYALENVTVIHADGREEAGVNLVIRRGLIQALGAGIGIPPDALILEGESLKVYPGLVDAYGKVALALPTPETAGEVLSWDPSREAQGFTPHRLAAQYLTAGGADLISARNAGVIAAGVHPEGGMAPGQGTAVLFRKTTETPVDLVVQPSVGLFFSFQGARGVYPGSLFAVVAHFRQMFEDAGRHGLILAEYARDPSGMTLPHWDPDFEILREAASGISPVFFLANDDEDIRRVLRLAEEIGFRPIIVGGEESWQVAGELASRNIPVLLSVAFPSPMDWDPSVQAGEGEDEGAPFSSEALDPAAAREKERLENAYSTAARLLASGVTVALTSGGGQGDLREGARKAMDYGLSEGDALRALTAVPASILGMPQITTVGPGMAANFIVADGPLFDEGTGIRYTFVEGELEESPKSRAAGGEAPSVDVSGSWEASLIAQGMDMSFAMTLTQEGSSFVGSMSGEMGDSQIENGSVSGNSLSFTIVFSMGTESMEIDSSATVTGDRMTGSGSSPMGSFTFNATRNPGTEGDLR